MIWHGTNVGDFKEGTASWDTLYGWGGDDLLAGGDGRDVIYGGDNNDWLDGGLDNDILNGEHGNDTLYGGYNLLWSGHDLLNGGPGNDLLDGGSGEDVLLGKDNNDTLLGGPDTDKLHGGTGSDSLDGGTHADSLYGWSGGDTLSGASGLDLLQGDDGADVMSGGDGADNFHFLSTQETWVSVPLELYGSTVSVTFYDRITDFASVEGDVIDLSAIDANHSVYGDQAFSFIGTNAFSGASGEVRYYHSGGNTYIEMQTTTSIYFEGGPGVIRLDGIHSPLASWFDL
jgi:Ca2+-binding RTX toxin-like protein